MKTIITSYRYHDNNNYIIITSNRYHDNNNYIIITSNRYHDNNYCTIITPYRYHDNDNKKYNSSPYLTLAVRTSALSKSSLAALCICCSSSPCFLIYPLLRCLCLCCSSHSTAQTDKLLALVDNVKQMRL